MALLSPACLHYLLRENSGTMLSKFFYAQWNREIKNDWTVQIKSDLDDFVIPLDLKFIKSKYVYSFRKVKAHEYELSEMNSMKGSKMEKTFHSKLEMQNYLKLKDLTVEDGKRIFAYRTRMANYGENFRGLSDPKQCPLCSTHLDNQQMAFICPQIKPNLYEAGKYKGIFKT